MVVKKDAAGEISKKKQRKKSYLAHEYSMRHQVVIQENPEDVKMIIRKQNKKNKKNKKTSELTSEEIPKGSE